MKEYALLLISTVLVNNFVLVQFLGLCPFMGVSRNSSASVGMGAATCFVLTVASAFSYVFDHYVLVPLELTYLRTLSFILLIACTVQFTEMVVKKANPELYRVLGIYLPLITTNCIVLGLALINESMDYNFFEVLVFSLGAGAGFALVLVIYAAMRERLAHADIPGPFKGSAIALVTAGLLSMAFMGFTNLISG